MGQTEQKANPNVYAVKLVSDKKRQKSQSGGAFTAAAESILSMGGVVYGVGWDKELKVVYKRIDTLKGLNELKGSKYVQAHSGGIYLTVEKDLQKGTLVLFSGTPCLVNGLYKYLESKACETEKLYTCDIVCHGTPSPQIYEKYLELLKKEKGDGIRKFTFRDKSFGWRRNISSYVVKGRKMITPNYIRIFESQLCLRKACFECSYASMNRVGDITVGDFWGIEKCHPEFEDKKGVSLLICSSKKGQALFDKMKDKLVVLKTTPQNCLQPNLQRPTKKPEAYEEFWQYLEENGYEAAIKKYCGYNPQDDWEKLEPHQFIKRVSRKIERLIKRKK